MPLTPVGPQAHLVLADGTVFEGEAIGALRDHSVTYSTGELVFNTAMSGYQEIVTDPSYAGQVISFTYPHIGNYGVNRTDDEARRPFCRGVIVRELSKRSSSWRSERSFDELLVAWGIGGLTGIDTRRLTRHVREAGALPCAFGTLDRDELFALARAEPGTSGQDLVSEVTTPEPYRVEGGPTSIVAYDFGIKKTMVRNLARLGSVEVVPASTPAADVLARRPDGVMLSNGPGDPAALGHLVAEVRQLVGEVPLFGICLGHQLLALALGADTFKLPFGHHGANHPVQRLSTGVVEITSQNHNYAVVDAPIQGASVTHRNLNDGVVEGLALEDARAFSVQYHPEAAPGPHDAHYLFDEFARLIGASR